MSDHGSASGGSDYPTSSEFSKEANARFLQAKCLLRQRDKDLFDTLSLIHCDVIPGRMVESYRDQISQLKRLNLVYSDEDQEPLCVDREARRWNWDQLVSNPEEYKVAFARACVYYAEEILNNAANPQQQIDSLIYVHELAVLYDDESHGKGFKANVRFNQLLERCAVLAIQNGMGGLAETLRRTAAKVRKDQDDKRKQ